LRLSRASRPTILHNYWTSPILNAVLSAQKQQSLKMLVVITCISWPRGRYPKILSLYWSTRSPKPRRPRPTPPVTQTRTRTSRARGRRGEARATSQSISDCSPRPKTTDDRVSVARSSDGLTDPSRRSRRADPALERETIKSIKDDRRARRASWRQRLTVTVEGVSQLTTTPLYVGDSYSVGVLFIPRLLSYGTKSHSRRIRSRPADAKFFLT